MGISLEEAMKVLDENATLALHLIKLRDTLFAVKVMWASGNTFDESYFETALSEPSPTTVNRIKSEALREAADLLSRQHTWLTNSAAARILLMKADGVDCRAVDYVPCDHKWEWWQVAGEGKYCVECGKRDYDVVD